MRNLYSIPYKGKYIVYRPLKPLAFIANAALVNLIAGIQDGGRPRAKQAGPKQALDFLGNIGFFEPDPPLPAGFSSGGPYRPSAAILFLTSSCNLRCVYCYASGGETKPARLEPAIGRRAVDIACENARALGLDCFTLGFHGGGEPTSAMEELKALVYHAKTRRTPCKITVATNGCWDDAHADWMLDNMDEISLSFDGVESVQNFQRPLVSGGGTFETVMKTIRKMDRRDFPYGIRMTVTDRGVDQLAESVEFICAETGCRAIQAEPAFGQGRALANGFALEDMNRFGAAFMEAWDLAADHDRHLYYSGARPWTLGPVFCKAPETALVVGPGGFVTACYEVFGENHPLAGEFFHGRLFSDGVLRMDDGVRKKLHEKIGKRQKLCGNCFCFPHCAGDCPAKVFLHQKDGGEAFGPRCDLNRMITKALLVRYIEAGGGVWKGGRLKILRNGCL